MLNEQREMAEARDKDRAVIKNQGELIESIKREMEEIRRRLTEEIVQNHRVVQKKMFNNSNSPTESQNFKAKTKQELIEIY